ncbi:hypothetical protein RUMOBE_00058 [Blautia obeum ATCC 29174]|uniref:Uncharacterized protein n=1 Tax=Blautia obeum ATCC 29174 TaxID=411459 RepID=A5ZM41_9FIRM|nr:hypothetical protein RUMOBE_00058 [Blautia obeum ATCC 29174]
MQFGNIKAGYHFQKILSMFISNSKSYGNHITNANKIKVSRTKVYIKEKENPLK